MLDPATLRATAVVLFAAFALGGVAEASLFKKQDTVEEQRAAILAMRDQTLADLDKLQPSARGRIQNAAGYAVFSNFGMKILVAGGGGGRGVVVDNGTRRETFMRMAEVYAGAVSVTPGVWLYQITDDGLALELTAKGTRYFKDDALN